MVVGHVYLSDTPRAFARRRRSVREAYPLRRATRRDLPTDIVRRHIFTVCSHGAVPRVHPEDSGVCLQQIFRQPWDQLASRGGSTESSARQPPTLGSG